MEVFELLDKMKQCCPIRCGCYVAICIEVKGVLQLQWNCKIKGKPFIILTEIHRQQSDERIELELNNIKAKIRVYLKQHNQQPEEDDSHMSLGEEQAIRQAGTC